jgi:HEAT repeat protein
MAIIKKTSKLPLSQNEAAEGHVDSCACFTDHSCQDERTKDRDYASLIQQLEHEDPLVRRWGARDLAEYPQAAAALTSRLLGEVELSVREVILSSLAAIGDETAVRGLVDCLRSEDALLRNEAIEIMKLLPDQVAPIMLTLLVDADTDVRIFAVNILESLRHPAVENWLIEVIQHDENVNVCATALDLLAEVGSKASEQPLTQIQARFPGEPYIRFAAEMALKRLAEN